MLRRVWAVIRKEVLHISRDRRTLFVMIVLPVAQLLVFGYAVETEVRHLPTLVVDHDRSQASWRYLEKLFNTGYFDLHGYVASQDELVAAIDGGRARVGIVIPARFAADLDRRTAQALVIIDGSDPGVARSALTAATSTSQEFAIQLLTERLSRRGASIETPVDLRTRVLYNPNMRSLDFMLPGIVGLIMQLQTLLLTAFAVVRERERGTIEQLLVTPIRPWELLLGKITPYVVFALLNTGMVLLIGSFWFGVPFKGSVLLFFWLSLLFLFSSLGLGLLISTVAANQQQAQQLAALVTLPSLLLSGYIFPRESMPALIRDVGALIPLTYFLQIIRGIILKGVGLAYLQQHAVPLAIFSFLVFGVSVVSFGRRLE
ncbi:MAG: ABC transporter permease [Anaerolineae bacterium]|nr:ABC transporter permease [Anaerolineae bacterium]